MNEIRVGLLTLVLMSPDDRRHFFGQNAFHAELELA
jgi:hypothetical protein